MSDEKLLQENPSQLLVKYQKVILQLIHRFWHKEAVSESELAVIEEIVFQRLPVRLVRFQKKAEGETFALTLLVECTQVICNDLQDLHFLHQKSPQLILKYLPYISARLDYLVNTNFFKAQDSEDVLQSTQQKLLERLQSGQLAKFQSNNETLFRTYLYRVVKNLFTDIYRSLYQTKKNRKQLELKAPLIAHKSDSSNNPFEQLSEDLNLSQQIRRLNQILQLFPTHNRIKFELCLKTNYYLILTADDVQVLKLTAIEMEEMLAFFGDNYHHESTGNIWKEINKYINIWESKTSNADTLRKWFTRQRNQITAKFLVINLIDRELATRKEKETTYHQLLQKINKDRNIAKYAHQWFGDIVCAYYKIH